MQTWDLTAAYHHLCINHKHWGCTGFSHKGEFYFAPRLNCGSQASPSRFNLYSEAAAILMVILFGKGGSLLPMGGAYVLVCHALLDDFWAMFERPMVRTSGGRGQGLNDDEYAKAVAITVSAINLFFKELGMIINKKKCDSGFELKYLGWILNSKKLTISCPP